MNKLQIQKLEAYRAGIEINENFNSVWSGDATYSDEVDTFNANINAIEDERDAQAADITGFTVAKNEKKGQLSKKTMRAIGNLMRFADVNGETELVSNLSKFTEKKLLKMKDSTLVGVVSIVLAKITEIGLGPLAIYNIDAGKVTEITNLKNDFIPMIGKPKALTDMKKLHTSNLKKLFVVQDSFIKKQLLPGAANFTEISSDYVEALNDALVPDSAASGMLALRIQAYEVPGTTPLQGMRMEIIGTPIFRITSALGRCRVKNLASGTYILHCTKMGFSPADVTVIVDNVTTTDAVISLAHV